MSRICIKSVATSNDALHVAVFVALLFCACDSTPGPEPGEGDVGASDIAEATDVADARDGSDSAVRVHDSGDSGDTADAQPDTQLDADAIDQDTAYESGDPERCPPMPVGTSPYVCDDDCGRGGQPSAISPQQTSKAAKSERREQQQPP